MLYLVCITSEVAVFCLIISTISNEVINELKKSFAQDIISIIFSLDNPYFLYMTVFCLCIYYLI